MYINYYEAIEEVEDAQFKRKCFILDKTVYYIV